MPLRMKKLPALWEQGDRRHAFHHRSGRRRFF
jgi:hypothetical protein